MLSLFWIVLWLALTGLMVAAAVRLHGRHKELTAAPHPHLDDAAIATILETGALTIDEDEPLDLSEIDESEERFWSESWDEPDEW
jgi:hypothetical protein